MLTTPRHPERIDPMILGGTRAGACAGVIFTVLVLASFLFPQPPTGTPSGQVIHAFLTDHRGILLLNGFLTGLQLIFLLWFSSALCRILRRVEGEAGALSTIAFGGAVALFGGALVVTGLYQGLTYRIPADPALTQAVWYAAQGATVLGGFIVVAFTVPASLLMTQMGPRLRWLGGVGLLASLLELIGAGTYFSEASLINASSPFGLISFLAFVVWVLATSLTLFATSGPQERVAERAAAAMPVGRAR